MDAARTMAVPLALIAAAVLGGCASGTSSTSAVTEATTPVQLTATVSGWPPPPRNEADGNFALELVSRSDRATRLANLAPQRTTSAQVAQFAATTVAGERSRRDELDVLLRRWCLYAPEAGAESLPDPDETRLSRVSGADFDRRFLTLLMANHQAVVTISTVELRDGRDTEATTLAQSNIAIRRTEIGTARDLLKP